MHCGMFLVQAFLPEDEIQPIYQQLSLQVTTAPLTQFENCMTKTRISCNKWPPPSWSIHMVATRSNNEIERLAQWT